MRERVGQYYFEVRGGKLPGEDELKEIFTFRSKWIELDRRGREKFSWKNLPLGVSGIIAGFLVPSLPIAWIMNTLTEGGGTMGAAIFLYIVPVVGGFAGGEFVNRYIKRGRPKFPPKLVN